MQKVKKAGNLLPMQFTANNGKSIRVITGEKETMFVARDVFEYLGIRWDGVKSLNTIPKEWRGVGKLPTPSGTQQVIVINEQAMYKVAFRSNKPEADRFTNWVAGTVLPSIRRKGSYTAGAADLSELPKLPATRINNRDMLPYRELLRAIGASAGGGAYARVKRYPGHFINFNGLTYVTTEMGHLIYISRKVYTRRKEIKAMPPVLPFDFGQPIMIGGGYV
jgi:prophage antirepressor-like protein